MFLRENLRDVSQIELIEYLLLLFYYHHIINCIKLIAFGKRYTGSSVILEVVIHLSCEENNGSEELKVIRIDRLKHNGMMQVCAKNTFIL